jgi:hypothetical protein
MCLAFRCGRGELRESLTSDGRVAAIQCYINGSTADSSIHPVEG